MATKKIKDLEGFVVNTKVIASILGMTERRVRQLVEEEIIDRVSPGRYNLVETIKKYLAYLRANKAADHENNQVKESLDYEKFLHERAKRELAELELAKLKGLMHHASDVERIMTKMLSDFRSKLLAMPPKVAPMLIARNDISVIQDLLQKEIYEALQELSDYDPSMFGEVGQEESDELEGEEDE